MGFLQWVRGQFDRGGIGMSLELPKEFKWSNGEIPLAVLLTGHKTEPRRVNGLRFTVVSNEKSNDDHVSTTQIRHVWDRKGTIELGPNEHIRLEISVPLPREETRAEAELRAFGRQASGFAEKAFLAVARGDTPSSINRYRVTVEGNVTGAQKPKRASKNIRQR